MLYSDSSNVWQERYAKNPQVITRQIAGEVLLVPISGELANMQKLFALNNAVSEYIWEHLDGSKPLKDVLQGVVDNFSVEESQAAEDILAFVQELQESGLISRRFI